MIMHDYAWLCMIMCLTNNPHGDNRQMDHINWVFGADVFYIASTTQSLRSSSTKSITDFGFKRITKNTKFVVEFLNSLLPVHITDVELIEDQSEKDHRKEPNLLRIYELVNMIWSILFVDTRRLFQGHCLTYEAKQFKEIWVVRIWAWTQG
jgi:hypothetical protein